MSGPANVTYLPSRDSPNHVWVLLIPVEVFGAEDGYGLCDAIGPGFSDCNRAAGHIFRIGDSPEDAKRGIPVLIERRLLPQLTRFYDGDHEPDMPERLFEERT